MRRVGHVSDALLCERRRIPFVTILLGIVGLIDVAVVVIVLVAR